MRRRSRISSSVAVCAFACALASNPCGTGAAEERGKVTKSATTEGLLDDLRAANAVVCVVPHCDDDIFFSGFLSLASLKFKKDTYVIAGTRFASVPPGGTLEMRHRDNAEMKELLGLKDYIRFDLREYPGTGTKNERFLEFLREFILEKRVDVIASFETQQGFNGHPAHKQLGKDVAALLESLAEKENWTVNLYCTVNPQPEIVRMRGTPVARPPHTHEIDLDGERVTLPDGRSLSLWGVCYEVFTVYKESVGGARRWYNNRDKWDRTFRHEEWYQKVSLSTHEERTRALSPQGEPKRTPEGGPPTTEEVLRQFDKNRDRTLTVDELPERARRRIMQADSDGDGVVTIQELETARQRLMRRTKQTGKQP